MNGETTKANSLRARAQELSTQIKQRIEPVDTWVRTLDPYRVLCLAASVGIAGGARLWLVLAGAGARIVIAAAVPSLIGAIRAAESGESAGTTR